MFLNAYKLFVSMLSVTSFDKKYNKLILPPPAPAQHHQPGGTWYLVAYLNAPTNV